MTHTRDTDTAWLAGVFEGEGCLHRRSNGGGWQLTIVMTDRDIIERVRLITGVGRIYFTDRTHKQNHQDVWRWHVGKREDIRAVVERLLPWVGKRRGDKMEEFLAWAAAGYPTTRTDEERERVRLAVARHRAANR